MIRNLEGEVLDADEELKNGQQLFESDVPHNGEECDDDKLKEARDRVKGCTSKLFELAQEL